MRKVYLLLTGFALIFLSACGGGGSEYDNFSEPSPPEITLTASKKLVSGGETYTVSWEVRNANSAVVKVVDLDVATIKIPATESDPGREIPQPRQVAEGFSGTLTETAVTGISKAYIVEACNGDLCKTQHIFVWEKENILDAYTNMKGYYDPVTDEFVHTGHTSFRIGSTLTVCVNASDSLLIRAVEDVVNKLNALLAGALTLTIANDPNLCNYLSEDYIILTESNTGTKFKGTAGSDVKGIDTETYYWRGDITIYINNIYSEQDMFTTVAHEFAHVLGFKAHVNPNLSYAFNYQPFLMSGDSYLGTQAEVFDELTTLTLRALYKLE